MLCAFIRACTVNSTVLSRIHNYLDVGRIMDNSRLSNCLLRRIGDVRSETR